MVCGGIPVASEPTQLTSHHVLLLSCAGFLAALLTACTQAPSAKTTADAHWHEFQGTWTAAGSRNSLHLEGARLASVSTFSGSVVLAGPSRPGIGFRSDAV